MTDVVVRCPYSLLGDNFRPMWQRPQWFICEQCGHEMLPDEPRLQVFLPEVRAVESSGVIPCQPMKNAS